MKKLATYLFTIYYLLFTKFVFAQGLVPVCNPVGPRGAPDTCNLCHLLQLFANVIYWMLNISVVLAGLFFAWGAILMLTARDSQEQVTSGKKTMTTAAEGILIAFTAWLILGTLIQVITGSPSKLPWNQIQCSF